jgi:hypothetical protein
MKAEISITENSIGDCIKAIRKTKGSVLSVGQRWAEDSARMTQENYRRLLETQGRDGGTPPPLSSATRYLYEQLGEPDGSGIRNHMEVVYRKTLYGAIAVFGIPKGKPTMIAKVQDRGAVIFVTQAMRGWLAVHGIYLRADTTHIVIPSRHAWSQAIRKSKIEAKKTLKRRIRQL